MKVSVKKGCERVAFTALGYRIIPTRSLNRNLNQFELSFIARGISIISVVCQIWSI